MGVEIRNEEKDHREKNIFLISLSKLMFLYKGNNKAVKSKNEMKI